METNPTKTCPDCGTKNDAGDLFCRSCGTSLALVDVDADTESTTDWYAPGDQPTETIAPVNASTEMDPPMSSSTETQTTAIAPTVSPSAPTPPVSSASDQFSNDYLTMYQNNANTYIATHESVRGAVLGWIAAVLILVTIGAFVWSTLLSDATRDRFTGFF